MKTILPFLFITLASGNAQFAVTISPMKITGQKAIVPLAMKNGFPVKIESARAVCFLLDERGRMVGPPTTRWIIGGSNTDRLPAGATNSFHFVVTSDRPFTTTNLTAKMSFSRVVLEGGRLVNVSKDVQILTNSR